MSIINTFKKSNLKSGLVISKNFLQLIRWPNLLMILLIQSALFYVFIEKTYSLSGINTALGWGNLGLIILTTILIAAAGYIINDYFDYNTDIINKPEKQIFGTGIPVRLGIAFYYILNSISVIIGFYLAYKAGSWRLGFLFPMIIILLWLYSAKYKRTILLGNLAVAFLAALVILIVWLFEFFMLRLNPPDFVVVTPYLKLITAYFGGYALFSFLYTLSREIIKDSEDIEGDRQSGIQTLAVVYGQSVVKKVSAGILIVSSIVLCVLISYLLIRNFLLVGLYFVFAVQLPTFYVIYRTLIAQTKSDFHNISITLKIIMLAGILGLQPIAMSMNI